MDRISRHSQRKRRETDRPSLSTSIRNTESLIGGTLFQVAHSAQVSRAIP